MKGLNIDISIAVGHSMNMSFLYVDRFVFYFLASSCFKENFLQLGSHITSLFSQGLEHGYKQQGIYV